jgi:hypothetical protein
MLIYTCKSAWKVVNQPWYLSTNYDKESSQISSFFILIKNIIYEKGGQCSRKLPLYVRGSPEKGGHLDVFKALKWEAF